MSPDSNQFYLGKLFDLKTNQLQDTHLNYDPSDLTTHAIITGMTGSGKTGLCISLLEEAALEGIPAIVVDPKGDLTNLLLNFPRLAPVDFEPWIDPEIARRAGKTIPQLASETAEQWRSGLKDWGLGTANIQALKSSVDRTIYTPGSTAGIPVNILASFAAPQLDWGMNQELLRDKIASVITALLTLIGMKDIDPLRSREHILLSNIVEFAWQQGKSLSLQDIILQTQNPPMDTLGAFKMDAFFPANDRDQLALLLNNFLASPTFQTWIEGQPLDAEELLYTKNGKARQSIFYVAHLDETERMFFITLLFAAVESWMRTQRGTGNLRSLIYFDEIMGYLPPVANPASKPIMIRMIKQARAFGMGLVLTTQNPVDLDYKALSNAGTWIIGRLQTDQDKQRLLDGLESAASGLARNDLDRMISALPKRVFLYQNIHQKNSLIFQSRWAMDYLAGPLTLTQIPALNALAGVAPFNTKTQAAKSTTNNFGISAGAGIGLYSQTYSSQSKPIPPANITEYYLIDPGNGKSIYHPSLLAQAEVNYYSRTPNVNFSRTITVLIDNPPSANLDWENNCVDALDLKSLPTSAQSGAQFDPLPSTIKDTKWWSDRNKDFENWIYESKVLIVYSSKKLGIISRPEETLDQFQQRCRQIISQGASTGNVVFDKKRDTLQNKINAQQANIGRLQAELTSRMVNEGGHVLGTLFNVLTKGRVSGVNSSLSAERQRASAQAKLNEAEQLLANLKQQMADLQGGPSTGLDNSIPDIQEIKIAPAKRDIIIKAFGLAWKAA